MVQYGPYDYSDTEVIKLAEFWTPSRETRLIAETCGMLHDMSLAHCNRYDATGRAVSDVFSLIAK